MIDQNTVVHISFDEKKSISLGKLAIFEYTEPGSKGRIKLVFSKYQVPMDKNDIGEIVKKVKSEILISIFTDTADYAYKTILEEVKISVVEEWETLEITAVRID
ncbi:MULTISPECIES: hypothetical protein [unclassified Cedecea]|uniref:hypothetical protein n=1 Tax=unclassified Cedecea TaxID=2649846 RepID=UPI00301B08AA